LPANAEVLRVVVRGETLNLRPEKGVLRLPLRPGCKSGRDRIAHQRGAGSASAVADAFKLGTHASNIEMAMQPAGRPLGAGHERAAHRAGGVVLGRAAGDAAAGIRDRTQRPVLPIRMHEAFLLGIGFSTVSWWSLVIFVAVLAAFACACALGQRGPLLAAST
jgi:hypothetical protein